jgi:transcriptional regulator with XRE-family HTH domain
VTTGDRIRKRRKEIGVNADALAEKIKVSRSTIFRYENGYIEKLPMKYLTPIAAALNTTASYLMGWSETPWEDEYRSRIIEYLQNADAEDLNAAGIDKDYVLWTISSKKDLSLDEACEIVDQLGLSIDEILGRNDKKPAAISGDGLSAKKRLLIDAILKLDDAAIDVIAATADALIARRGR